MYRKVIAIALCVFFFHGCASKPVPEPVAIDIRAFDIVTPHDHQFIEIRWPQITGLVDQEIQRTVNKELFAWFMETASDHAFASSASTSPKLDSPPKPPRNATKIAVPDAFFEDNDGNKVWSPFWHRVSAEAFINDKHLLGIEQAKDIYTGGAHNNIFWSYRLYDLSTGKSLQTEDIFIGDFKPLLQELVTDHLPTRIPVYHKPATLRDPIQWYMTETAFVVHFPTYAIASYADGPVNVEIPWDKIRPLLREDSPLHRID